MAAGAPGRPPLPGRVPTVPPSRPAPIAKCMVMGRLTTLLIARQFAGALACTGSEVSYPVRSESVADRARLRLESHSRMGLKVSELCRV